MRIAAAIDDDNVFCVCWKRCDPTDQANALPFGDGVVGQNSPLEKQANRQNSSSQTEAAEHEGGQ